MVPREKKEAPALPKAKAKVKASKAKKMLKGFHSHKKRRSSYHAPSDDQRHCDSQGSLNILERAPPGETCLNHYAIIKFPLTAESAIKKIEDNNTLAFIVDVKANSTRSKRLWRSSVIRCDGEKMAYVQLAPDCHALDVINKMGSSKQSPAGSF